MRDQHHYHSQYVISHTRAFSWLILTGCNMGAERLVSDSQSRTRAVMSAVDRELATVQAAMDALATPPEFDAQGLRCLSRPGSAKTSVPDAGAYQHNIRVIGPWVLPRVLWVMARCKGLRAFMRSS